MKKVVFIDHHDSYAGNILGSFSKAGADVKIFQSDCSLDVIAAQKPDLILLGPGESSPDKSGNYLAAIERFHKDYPMFGICLGFQAMMHYFKEPVVVLAEAVHGEAVPVFHQGRGIFQGIPSPAQMARYNSLGAYGVPETFNALATSLDSNGKQIIMAAKHDTLPIAGVQFHPESFLSNANGQGHRLNKNVLEQLVR
jgi:anthranilate synthase/aminodeoxychorismate synthase-like glutamine amidotransferase